MRSASVNDRRAFLTNGMAAMAASLVANCEAEAAPASRMVVQRDMPAVNLDGWQMTAVEVTISPGEGSARHHHPGFVIGYVLEGQYTFAVAGKAEAVLSPGEMFFEVPGDVHAVSANASTTQPAKILAMVFTPKGQPVTIPG